MVQDTIPSECWHWQRHWLNSLWWRRQCGTVQQPTSQSGHIVEWTYDSNRPPWGRWSWSRHVWFSCGEGGILGVHKSFHPTKNARIGGWVWRGWWQSESQKAQFSPRETTTWVLVFWSFKPRETTTWVLVFWSFKPRETTTWVLVFWSFKPRETTTWVLVFWSFKPRETTTWVLVFWSFKPRETTTWVLVFWSFKPRETTTWVLVFWSFKPRETTTWVLVIASKSRESTTSVLVLLSKTSTYCTNLLRHPYLAINSSDVHHIQNVSSSDAGQSSKRL